MTRPSLIAAAAASALLGTYTLPANASSATSDHPVVIELFQSQGCSSCPPANANVNAIADRPDVLALSFAVTYWDQLGWKDTFGSPRWTARQWDYARRAGRPQVATPQVIVNGGPAIVGSNRQQLDAVIEHVGPPRDGPELTVDHGALKLAAGPRTASSTVWLVRYDPGVRDVAIRAGENGGKTLPAPRHRARAGEARRLERCCGKLPPASHRGAGTRVRDPRAARLRRHDHRRPPHLIVPADGVAAGRPIQTPASSRRYPMRAFTLLGLCAVSLSAAAPAFAQDAMASHDNMASHDQMASGGMKMSAADMRKMKSCNAMSHDAMMKNAGCAKMMKAHPDMMKQDDMMKSAH